MGDRAQIAVRHGKKLVWLYTHWGGSEIYANLAAALKRGRSRWDDEEYLTRIIFSEMVKDGWEACTGFGIGVGMHGDIEYHVPIVDGEEQMITWRKCKYCSLPLPEPVSFETFIEEHYRGDS